MALAAAEIDVFARPVDQEEDFVIGLYLQAIGNLYVAGQSYAIHPVKQAESFEILSELAHGVKNQVPAVAATVARVRRSCPPARQWYTTASRSPVVDHLVGQPLPNRRAGAQGAFAG